MTLTTNFDLVNTQPMVRVDDLPHTLFEVTLTLSKTTEYLKMPHEEGILKNSLKYPEIHNKGRLTEKFSTVDEDFLYAMNWPYKEEW